MNRTFLSVLSLCSLLAVLAACGTVNTVSTREGPSASSVPYIKQINDSIDSIFLNATDVRRVLTPGGVLKAQVDIANDDFRTRRFAYRFEWLDQAGTVLESRLSSWEQKEIPSGGMTTLSSVAPSKTATDFRLQVRASD